MKERGPCRRAVFVTLAVGCLTLPAIGGESGPAVPGFARFHAADGTDVAAGGRLLLGELNCTACHNADAATAQWFTSKPAPVLNEVASRVRPDYLRRFLADPQAVDRGTTMPHVFAGVDSATRDDQIESLVHFLAANGTVADLRSDSAAVRRGEALYHSIGCAVCHGERRDEAAELPTDVPLPDLQAKYGIPALAAFLRTPHAVRPGGRMPSLGLDEKQALDLAHFLIPDANPKPKDPRLTYKVYEGNFGNLPDFLTLTPVAEGQSDGFDVYVAGKEQNFAIVFEGFLKIDRAAEYWFLLASDDGSKLYIDGELVSNNDGIHAATTMRGAKKLEPGVHRLRVEYAQVAGEQKLSLQYEAPELPRQPVANAVFLTSETVRLKPANTATQSDAEPFRLDPSRAAKGRELFASLGCANCHQKKDGEAAIAATKSAPALSDLARNLGEHGCLSAKPSAPAVAYGLTARQRDAVLAALAEFSTQLAKSPIGPLSSEQRVDLAFERLNCYACHERGGKGGVEPERNHLFATAVPEMGDEGRIPPHLNGVGDKLTVGWMSHLLDKGATDRKYMRTRMPSFGAANVGFLAETLAGLDERTEATVPMVSLPKHRIESVGRQLVGESALSCIKCHDFGQYSGTGIQAIDLKTMTRRLRHDWFVRYMLDPQEYRPGTRMPSAFPKGKSAVRDVLGGKADQQLAAIWTYLELGANAPVPAGTVRSAIVLEPKERPIVYRGFLEGLSPRAIAVGYPEQAHLAFDAERMSLALIWHNAFLDAAMHWEGRGSGNQRPLGDHVLPLVQGVPLAVIPDVAVAWPDGPAHEQGWQFRGYRLDKKGRPTFRYGTTAFTIEDTPQPIAAEIAEKPDAVLQRTLTIAPADGSLPDQLYARIAAGKTISALGDDGYRVDDALTVRLLSEAGDQRAVIRQVEAGQELLVPLPASRDAVTIKLEYEW